MSHSKQQSRLRRKFNSDLATLKKKVHDDNGAFLDKAGASVSYLISSDRHADTSTPIEQDHDFSESDIEDALLQAMATFEKSTSRDSLKRYQDTIP